MKAILKFVAKIFCDERFERKVLALSVLIIAISIALNIASPFIKAILVVD